MKGLPYVVAALLLSACSDSAELAVPSDNFIDLIEGKLANHRCVGDLSRWERTYRFAKPTGFSAYTMHADIDVIEFHLRRAGTATVVAGRTVLPRGEADDWPDGKYVRSVDGRYKLGGAALQLSSCVPLNPSRSAASN